VHRHAFAAAVGCAAGGSAPVQQLGADRRDALAGRVFSTAMCVHRRWVGRVAHACSQGRMKYVRPMYKGLFRSKMGKTAAVDTFLAHRASLHPIAQKMVGSDLGLK
jgi:hypothetical protein